MEIFNIICHTTTTQTAWTPQPQEQKLVIQVRHLYGFFGNFYILDICRLHVQHLEMVRYEGLDWLSNQLIFILDMHPIEFLCFISKISKL